MKHRFVYRSSHPAREGKVLLGCLVALAAVLILAIVGTVMVVMNWQRITGSVMEIGTDALVAQLPIDQGEKDEVMAHMDGLITRFKNKEIDADTFGGVVESIVESPAIRAGLLSGAAQMYLEPSSLTEEAKADGANQFRRLAHGLFTEQINPEQLGDILEPLRAGPDDTSTITIGLQYGPSGKKEYKILAPSAVTEEKLNEMIAAARAKADEALIDETTPELDLSDEIAKAIEEATAQTDP